MIEPAGGNILTDDAEALVNTVNCAGVMGKGIALQFKKAFPENFKAYEAACRRQEVKPGHMFVKNRNIRSVALPPLGSGLGGLQWCRVKKMIEAAFEEIPDIQVKLYEPANTPDANDMPVGTPKPGMTVARALLIKLMKQYSRFAYRLTLLEIQKLAYFLQESGMDLRLRYVKHLYGPYAHNLNKVLEILEGHYIRGYGDTQKPDVEITLLQDAEKAADNYLRQDRNASEHLERVADLVDGFETPYGMELMASVHWAFVHEGGVDSKTAVEAMARWNDRKRRLFKPEHIHLAWTRLNSEGWLKA